MQKFVLYIAFGACLIALYLGCNHPSGSANTEPTALQNQRFAQASHEFIDLFKSEIQVVEDGSLLIKETIRIHCMGINIRRGIFRDFPIVYPGNTLPFKASFDLQSVLRNGKPEAWRLEDYNSYVRIYLGNENVFLNRGYHEYEITYITNRQFRYFDDYDELYWNVTGNYWNFEIKQTEAHIRFPEGAEILQYDAYVGQVGDTLKDFTAVSRGQEITFKSTRSLKPQEGISVAAAINKGVVYEPTPEENQHITIYSDFRYLVNGLIGLGILLIFYFIAWLFYGRDPRGGTIIPLYEPPSGWGPLEVGTIYRNMFHNSMASAAFIDLAIKGYVKIENLDSPKRRRPRKFRIVTLSHEYKNDLGKDSHLLFAELFGWGKSSKRKSIRLDGTYSKTVADALKKLKDHLKDLTNRKFEFRFGFAFMGFAVSFIMALYLIFNTWTLPQHESIMVISMIIGVVAGSFMYLFMPLIFGTIVMTYPRRVVRFHLILLTIIAFLVGYTFMHYESYYAAWAGILIFIYGAIGGMFCNLLWRPTIEGRKKVDKILGFKMFLSVGESGRIKNMHTPELTPHLFESYMPYAMSLGVEKQWTALFRKVLTPQQWSDVENRSRTYMHTSFVSDSGNFSSSFNNVSRGLSSATTSTSTPPSSSGSGGGGSSGGGGGGGGGGGW